MQRSEYLVIERQESKAKTEVVAGVTTFLTMAYIIFVNPAILSEAGMDQQALVIVTCIVSAVTTAVTGLVAQRPDCDGAGHGAQCFSHLQPRLGRPDDLADGPGGRVPLRACWASC